MAERRIQAESGLNRKTMKKNTSKVKSCKGKIDYGFLAVCVTLIVIGLLMVFSASFPSAYYYQNKNGYFYIQRQTIWAVAGAIAMAFTINFPYKAYKKFAKIILIVSGILLLLVLIAGKEINGAKRWLGVGSMTIQPSETAKLGLIIFFAYLVEKDGKNIGKFKPLIKYAGILVVFMGLMMLQPHFSVCIIIGLTSVVMLIAGGAKIRYFAMALIPAIPAGIALVIYEPYRLARVLTFLHPFEDTQGAGWQVIQSLYAIGSGGLFGVGFGNSRQKYMYVPEPQNDFIFSIVCEELGLIGASAILLLFGILIFRGMKIAINAPDTFSSMLVTGIISLVAVQVVLNIAVVSSSIPTTGIPLPFFSYGGSALFFLMASMGIVLNVSKYSKKKEL